MPSSDADSPQRGRAPISVYLMFWVIGCIGLVAFRGIDPDEDPAETGIIPPATLIALALYTAVIAIIYVLPRRR